jgi:hypothetical protein
MTDFGTAWWVGWRLQGSPDDLLHDIPLSALLAVPKALYNIAEWEDFWDFSGVPDKITMDYLMSGDWQKSKPVPSLHSPSFLRSGDYVLEFAHGNESDGGIGFRVTMPPAPGYPDTGLPKGYVQTSGPPRKSFHRSGVLSFERALEALRASAVHNGALDG